MIKFTLGCITFSLLAGIIWLQTSGNAILLHERTAGARNMVVECVYFNGRHTVVRMPRSALADRCDMIRTL